MQEEWREVAGYEGLYEVSSIGRVRSYYTRSAGISEDAQMMRPYLASGKRYLAVDLYTPQGKSVQVLAHRLVAHAFLEARVADKHIDTNHIDGIKTHNCYTNLEFSSRRDNITHVRHLREHMRQALMRTSRSVIFAPRAKVFISATAPCR